MSTREDLLKSLVSKLMGTQTNAQRLSLLAGITVIFDEELQTEEMKELAKEDFKTFVRKVILSSIVTEPVGDVADTSAMLAMAKSSNEVDQDVIDRLAKSLEEIKARTEAADNDDDDEE